MGQWPHIPASTWAIKVWLDFGSLWGHYSLQTASYIKYDLRFEISDPNYLLIPVHIADMVWALMAASEATTASKQPRRSNLTSDLKSVTPITYLSMCILLIWCGPFWQPPRPPQPPNSLEVKSDLRFQISGLNYICNQSFKTSLLVKKWLYGENMTIRGPWPA